MRNFYLTADIDGRQTYLHGGPRGKEGGMVVDIRQRDEGKSVVAFSIQCQELGGHLATTVYDGGGQKIAALFTER